MKPRSTKLSNMVAPFPEVEGRESKKIGPSAPLLSIGVSAQEDVAGSPYLAPGCGRLTRGGLGGFFDRSSLLGCHDGQDQ